MILIHERLLPVTCIVVRSIDATHHEALVLALILKLGIEVDAELVVETLEELLPWHLRLEERNIYT